MSKVYDDKQRRLSPELSTEDQTKRPGDTAGLIQSTSKRSSSRSFLSRSVRARRRRAFLKTYQLSQLDNNSVASAETSDCHEKMRQATIKLKSVVVSWAIAARLSLLRRRETFRPLLCTCASIPPSPSIRLG